MRLILRLIWRTTAVLVILGLCPVTSQAKKVYIEWKPIKHAVKYELKVELDGKSVFSKDVPGAAWKGELGAGIYTYQIRAVDRIKRPGIWSPPRALVVMPEPPKLKYPDDGDDVTLFSPKAKAALKWDPVPGADSYSVELYSGKNLVHRVNIGGTETEVSKLPPGKYSWKVSAVIRPKGRAPASIQGRQWLNSTKDVSEFTIEHKTLEPPAIVAPPGSIPPSSDKRTELKWKKVDGAQAYRVTYLASAGAARASDTMSNSLANAKTLVTTENNITVDTPGEGLYAWEVQALANYDARKTAQAEGPKAHSKFEVNRNAVFPPAEGYVALSTLIAPYEYHIYVPHPTSPINGGAKSAAFTLRLSGEYWFSRQFGASAGFDDTFFTLSGQNYQRKSFELMGKYRMMLKNGWFLNPKAGLEMREYVQTRVDPYNPSATNLSVYSFYTGGIAAGIDLRKQLGEKFSIGAKLSYFLPLFLSGGPPGSTLHKASETYRNANLGIQGLYWLGRSFGLGAGAYLETRSISYQSNLTPTISSSYSEQGGEKISMDGAYFFASLIYNFR